MSERVLYKRSDALFQHLVEKAPRPMLVTNDKVKIVYVNDAWRREFGYTLRQVAGKNPRILQSGKTPRVVYKKMWRLLKRGKAFESDAIIDRRSDGSLFNIYTTTFPLRMDGSLFYVQILDNVSHRKANDELRDLLLRTAAHDIRNPLANLQVISELLSKSIGGAADVARLGTELARLQELVTVLLDPEHHRDGKMNLRRQPIDLCREFARLARSFDKRTRFRLPKREVLVLADSVRLQQVVANLVDNALKYSGGKPVDVVLKCDRSRALVAIADRGPGIPRRHRARIFEAFYRVAGSDVSGSGLGLYIVKRTLRAHGGSIKVESRAGGGSVFSFKLPLANVIPTR